jgi:hypothetical protein
MSVKGVLVCSSYRKGGHGVEERYFGGIGNKYASGVPEKRGSFVMTLWWMIFLWSCYILGTSSEWSKSILPIIHVIIVSLPNMRIYNHSRDVHKPRQSKIRQFQSLPHTYSYSTV